MLQCAKAFYDFLLEKEFHPLAEDDGEETVIKFPYDNKMTIFIFIGEKGEYVSIYTQYESVSEDKFADALIVCNELNAEYKWLEYYVDGDNDLMIQNDALLDPSSAAEECFELLFRRVKIFDSCKFKIMRALYL